MKPLATPLAASLTALVLMLALQAQSAPPSAGPEPWRPVIVVDPQAVLRSPKPHPAAKHRPAPGRRSRPHARALPAPQVFERYDTAPTPHPR